MTCPHPQRQQDEWFCARCKRRWPTDDRPTDCPGGLFSGVQEAQPAPAEDELILAVAQAIAGPRLDLWIGRQRMLELRRHKWDTMLTQNERRENISAARAAVEEFRRRFPETTALFKDRR